MLYVGLDSSCHRVSGLSSFGGSATGKLGPLLATAREVRRVSGFSRSHVLRLGSAGSRTRVAVPATGEQAPLHD